ncbi:uncharacterized protein [Drosophila kikkawai]|uniref:Uncharacterized protein isoform X2 n=1 Tax=Drosophila kikkawai TaxID=30033 RepID=A0A6P4JUI8_DROKI|nr:uncharacterized protein LOC108086023 isoform X2 [Drosophila kikkawai]
MYIKVISIGLFLSTCHLLVQSIPIKYHNTQPTQNDAVHGPAAGMVLFPKLSDGRIKKIHPIWRKGQGDDFVNQRSKGKAKLFGKQKSDTDETADSSTKMTEMTVSVPDLKTDRFGKLVFDTWGDTLGDPVEDTRFKEYHRGSPSVEFRAPMMTFSTYREEKSALVGPRSLTIRP